MTLALLLLSMLVFVHQGIVGLASVPSTLRRSSLIIIIGLLWLLMLSPFSAHEHIRVLYQKYQSIFVLLLQPLTLIFITICT